MEAAAGRGQQVGRGLRRRELCHHVVVELCRRMGEGRSKGGQRQRRGGLCHEGGGLGAAVLVKLPLPRRRPAAHRALGLASRSAMSLLAHFLSWPPVGVSCHHRQPSFGGRVAPTNKFAGELHRENNIFGGWQKCMLLCVGLYANLRAEEPVRRNNIFS